MTGYYLSEDAFRDLRKIWNYIAADNSDAADQFELIVYEACDLIAALPMAGAVRKDFTLRPVRFHLLLPYRTYWIVYDPSSRPVEIIRILHTSFDIVAVLGYSPPEDL